nr:putative ribonuclease H-like domain-containing protein [Tanacetum cinerariifolium]
MNACRKSKSARKPVNKKVWKTTGKVFKTIGYQWKPTARTFMIVGNVCRLTRIANATIVPPREPPINLGDPVPMFLLLPLIAGTVKFGNDHVAKIMGYGDYQIGNVTISRVYYVVGLGNNLFSVGQFCDSDLEVAFHQHTCFIRNLEGVDLLTGSRGNNLYTLSLQDMMASSPIFRRIRTDNGTEYVNQTLRDYYEEVGISHETSVARSPQQIGVVERRNWTLIEAARTMLIYAQAPLFLWAEAMATACFTQNRSIIRLRHGKTPYELMHGKQPDLSYFHVFGALCYPTNDAMASEQSSSGPALQEMTPATICSGLVQKPSSSISYVPPTRNDWDLLFQPLFDELLNPPPIDQDAPLPSKSLTPTEIQSPIILQDVGNDNLDIEVAHMGNDPLLSVPTTEVASGQSSSTASPQTNVQPNHP